jgi:hypothetical protein
MGQQGEKGDRRVDSGNSGRGKGKQIAVVLFPGVSALELIGTTSVLNGLGLRTGFRTVTVGPSRDPVAAETPLELIPESTFDQVPHPFGIVVPGGGIRTIAAMGDEALLGYLGAAVIESVQLERGLLRRARLMHFDVVR